MVRPGGNRWSPGLNRLATWPVGMVEKRGTIDAAPSTDETGDPIWARLEDQIGWYESRSAQAQRTHKRLKIVQIIVGAVIPFLAGFQEPLKAALPDRLDLLPSLLIAALGVVVVVLEGVQHLDQYQETWLGYRSTAEALQHEKLLFLAGAGPCMPPRRTSGPFWRSGSRS